MAISRAEARIVTEEIRAAVTAILEKHDLVLDSTRSNYGDSYGFKVTANKPILNRVGFDMGTNDAREWLMYGKMSLDADGPFEDPASVLGKVVTIRGTEYTFMGYSGRSPKYPLRFKRTSDGKTYKFPESALRSLR